MSIIINLLSIINNFVGFVYTITDLKLCVCEGVKKVSQYTLCFLTNVPQLVQYPKRMQHLKYALRVSESKNTGYWDMTH